MTNTKLEWNPKETCPKDRPILVKTSHAQGVMIGCWANYKDWWACSELARDDFGRVWFRSHYTQEILGWMDLPEVKA